jgi:hypothetical protein
MKDGFGQVVDRLLEHKYPHHPRFGEKAVTLARLEKVRGHVERLLGEPDRRMDLGKTEADEVRAVADPLGITETSDTRVLWVERPFSELDQQRERAGIDTPTVGQVRGWLDPQRTRGLQAEVQDVLIALYAAWSGRTFLRDGKSYALPRPGALPDDAVLLRPELPSQAEWSRALERAGELFGVAIGARSLGARNLAEFCQKVKESAQRWAEAAELPSALEPKLREWGKSPSSGASSQDTSEGAPRLATARCAAELLSLIQRFDGTEMVRQLASFVPTTSLVAMEKNFTTAAQNKRQLEENAGWIVFQQVRARLGSAETSARARHILDDLGALLAADEVNHALAKGLEQLTRRAGELLREPAAPVVAPTAVPTTPGFTQADAKHSASPQLDSEEVAVEASTELASASAAAATLRELASRIENLGAEPTRVSVRVTAWKRRAE